MDWYGVHLVNISTKQVFQIQLYQDQALYYRNGTSSSNRSQSNTKPSENGKQKDKQAPVKQKDQL